MDILRPDLFIHKLDAPLDPETELADGSGRMETITGSVYSGTFRRGRMTEGRFEWPDGARFEGTVGGVRDGDALTGDGVFEW